MGRRFFFSKHFAEKRIDVSLAIDCIETGKRTLEEKPGKFKSSKRYRKGELIVVWRNLEEHCFVITAYWKK